MIQAYLSTMSNTKKRTIEFFCSVYRQILRPMLVSPQILGETKS